MNLHVLANEDFCVGMSLGLTVGLAAAVILTYLILRSYKRTLQYVAKHSGYEKINGKWYLISESAEHMPEIFDDMGIPPRVHNP